jgi:serine-type D-Ala-D-Ala carboxypeptidase/endopeptidase (penicillin-binding protein 4)
MRRVRAHTAALLLLAVAAGCAASPGRGIDGVLQRFVTAVHAFGGRVGVAIAEADGGAWLVAFAAEQGFVPASNLKLVSAAVALQTLGPEATLRTELLRVGPVRDGVLIGDLVLRGFGDPTLGCGDDARFATMAAAVQALGVRRIDGSLRGDGGWLGDERLGRGWEVGDLGEDYAAPFGGLCYGGNVRVVDGGDGAVQRVPVADPAAFAAAALGQALSAAGIEITGTRRAVSADDDERLLCTVQSPPLAQLLVPMLRDSDNLVAEQLWRVAARRAGVPGTDFAAQHTTAQLAALGVDASGLVFADGSGLSRLSLLRPDRLVALLAALHRSPLRAPLVAALPLAGASGTLRERFVDGPARGHVRAKTGTLQRVTCLSGYLDRPHAEPLAFSILWNDFLGSDADAHCIVDTFVQDLAAAVGW